jgi:glycosyltransferase involved in cell wall biosynthesis
MPLVSIGMPVRNGGSLFREALTSVVEQDYPNIEIIISDNGSTDETAAIASEFARRDSRIRYVRQERLLNIFENFLFVLKSSRGEYFAWAAHDDTRSPDFVSKLLSAFSEQGVVLAFGDLFIRKAIDRPAEPKHLSFDNTARSPVASMLRQAFAGRHHFYGLWQARFLKNNSWTLPVCAPEVPLLMTATALGRCKHVEGAQFIYYAPVKSYADYPLYHLTKARPLALSSRLDLFSSMWRAARASMSLPLALLAVLFVVGRECRDTILYPGVVAKGLLRQAGILKW